MTIRRSWAATQSQAPGRDTRCHIHSRHWSKALECCHSKIADAHAVAESSWKSRGDTIAAGHRRLPPSTSTIGRDSRHLRRSILDHWSGCDRSDPGSCFQHDRCRRTGSDRETVCHPGCDRGSRYAHHRRANTHGPPPLPVLAHGFSRSDRWRSQAPRSSDRPSPTAPRGKR